MSRSRRGTPTSTSNFGSSRRENHDASGFYQRFTAPEISADDSIKTNDVVDEIYCADARDMRHVETNSIALVVTSPPYFAGKQYEEALGEGGVPATYFEYLALLRDVFEECKRVLEPGGRIAINVANLGRRPFKSLAGDVTQILEDLGLLLRGEVVWWKGRAAGGSCAWGTFQKPNNPVLRDVTERIVIASKGRFDRAVTAQERALNNQPSHASITRDEFLEATTDLWEIAPESANRVGHPAPFPVEIPQRLIELYTYENDVVLDPFMGSGSTAVASVRTQRHYIGYDTDGQYVSAAKLRLTNETANASPTVADDNTAFADAIKSGLKAKEVAAALLAQCGFSDIRQDIKIPTVGIELALIARDASGNELAFDVVGSLSTADVGLRKLEAVWKAIGKASVLQTVSSRPLVILTSSAPAKSTPGAATIKKAIEAGTIHSCLELLDPITVNVLENIANPG